MPEPFVSIVIVAWNSGAHLSRCLSLLLEQTYQDFEIVLVDNGSTDGSVKDVRGQFPSLAITVKQLETNLGFAVANNIGVQLAKGKWIALLNADAYPEPDWLNHLLLAVENNPGFMAFSSRQLQYSAPFLLDGAGDAYHISGLAWRNSYNLTAEKNGLEEREIFSPCAAAALYSREVFLKVGGFDEDYFSYFEDVDLGFRFRIHGKKCLYVPNAIVHHVGSASTGKRGDFSVYYGYRNMVWTFVKDMPSPYFGLFLPLHLFTLSFFIAYLTMRGQGGVIVRAIRDALRGLPMILKKRREIQSNIQVKPGEILQFMSRGLLEPYQEFVKRNRRG
jgi:GT2 family glycosyltransferase